MSLDSRFIRSVISGVTIPLRIELSMSTNSAKGVNYGVTRARLNLFHLGFLDEIRDEV